MSEGVISGIFTLLGVILGAALTLVSNIGRLSVFLKKISYGAIAKQNPNNGDRLSCDLFDDNLEKVKFDITLSVYNSKNNYMTMNDLSIEFEDIQKRKYAKRLSDLEQSKNINGLLISTTIGSYNLPSKITSTLYLRCSVNISKLKNYVDFSKKTIVRLFYFNQRNKKIILKQSEMTLLEIYELKTNKEK